MKNYDNFHIFITRLLKAKYTNSNITLEAKDILNKLIYYLINKYIEGSYKLCKYANKNSLNGQSILTLTKIWATDSNRIIDQCNEIWENYSNNKKSGLKKHVRAGLYLPPARIKEQFKKQYPHQPIKEKAYLYLTITIEYIINQLLSVAVEVANEYDYKTVTGIHLYKAIHYREFYPFLGLFRGIFIVGLGTIGNDLLVETQRKIGKKQKIISFKN